jgi:hypothetical protein
MCFSFAFHEDFHFIMMQMNRARSSAEIFYTQLLIEFQSITHSSMDAGKNMLLFLYNAIY